MDNTDGAVLKSEMSKPSISGLRKSNTEGDLYTRPANIQGKLTEIQSLSREEILARSQVEDEHDPKHIPSECLVYLVRQCREIPPDGYFETLYKALAARVLHGLPPAGVTELTESNIRDETFHRFVELLAKDRLSYQERLDFFEVRFAKSLAALRTDAERKAYRDKKRSAPLEIDHDTGELSQEVENAAAISFDFKKIDDFDYRLRLDKAIDALPTLQKAIIEMIRKDIAIDSKEPGAVTISKTLGKSEKTIRTHRDKAFQFLRAALTKGETR